VVRNGFRQQANVPDRIVLKLNDIKLFMKEIQLIKLISKQNSPNISFKLHLRLKIKLN